MGKRKLNHDKLCRKSESDTGDLNAQSQDSSWCGQNVVNYKGSLKRRNV